MGAGSVLMKLIHYGNTIYDPDQVKPIKNRDFMCKPEGGLWTSPVGSDYSWLDWCRDEQFRTYPEDQYFIVVPRKSAKIYKIDSHEDLLKVPHKTEQFLGNSLYRKTFVDFEKMSEDYDMIYLTWQGQCRTRLSNDMDLYGWDCESVLVMNPDSIYQIS